MLYEITTESGNKIQLDLEVTYQPSEMGYENGTGLTGGYSVNRILWDNKDVTSLIDAFYGIDNIEAELSE